MKLTYAEFKKAMESDKMPRKIKKNILGKKINKTNIKRMINNLEIETSCSTVYIKPFEFCPKCGCRETMVEDHGVPYPEIWVDIYCLRCGQWVCGADNSRFHHILEEHVDINQITVCKD